MKGLSFIELIAVLFTGVAGLASAVQAYVSWETRGEVSRAIVFAQRIDACSQVMAAIEPFVSKARPEARAKIVNGPSNNRYSLPQFYYRKSSGNAAFRADHGPRVERWRLASAAFVIVSPAAAIEPVKYFDQVITREIAEGRFMNQEQLTIWLERLETQSHALTANCRALL